MRPGCSRRSRARQHSGKPRQRRAPMPSRVEEIVVTGSRIARTGLFLDQPDRHRRPGSHRAERHGQHRAGDESVAAVRAGPDPEHRRRRGARGTRLTQPAWPRRNAQSRAARRPAPAAVERECGRRRQPDSAVHPEGVETITGGASAVYGSDAMSGVVNFKSLDRLRRA